MTVLGTFIEVLAAYGITVYEGPPGKAVEPPAVVIAPGSPDWLTPEAFKGLREAVRASAVVLPGEESAAAVRQLRALSVRVYEAAAQAGALWQGASPPALSEIQGVSFLASTHRLTVPLEEEL